MRNAVNTGIYFSHSTNNHYETIDYPSLNTFIKSFPWVIKFWNSDENPLSDYDLFVDEIRKNNIQRIILAGYRPGFIKTFFARIMRLAGENPASISVCDLLSDIPPDISGTEWAKAKLSSVLYEVPFDSILSAKRSPVQSDTLIIGAGIAGIQASLEIANSHHKVYLVEKSGTIGGHMAMFDKTFPTLDCAACILTPKMVEVGQHPYIELITYSQVESVSGEPGNYQVQINKKARRVSIDSCTGCGTCAEKCPSKTASEFDAGTILRKAIYMPFPQAVPNKYLIDESTCRYVQSGKCGVCVKVCPVENCINLDEQDEILEIKVGNIIIATGFKPFDAIKAEQYGYGKFPNVITSLELERLVNASGPTGGHISMRTQDKKGNWIFEAESPAPKSLAIIHCIGSRDENHNKYCSRVCCMYSLKLAHLIREKLPDASITEYYIDMRAYGKGYEEFFQRIERENIKMVRGRTAKITLDGSHLVLRSEDIENSRLLESKVDMVVLAIGLEPGPDTGQIAKMLGIKTSADGWLAESNLLKGSTQTHSGGIHLAGTCQGPKDIPDSVAQGSAAAARVIQSIVQNSVPENITVISPEAIRSKAEELHITNQE